MKKTKTTEVAKVDPDTVWPKRMRVSLYLKVGFTGRRPCVNWLKKCIDEGIYYGERIGTQYFIFVDRNWQAIKLKESPKPVGKMVETGNPQADRLMTEYIQQHATTH